MDVINNRLIEELSQTLNEELFLLCCEALQQMLLKKDKASGDFCRQLINFAKGLDPDQNRQNVIKINPFGIYEITCFPWQSIMQF